MLALVAWPRAIALGAVVAVSALAGHSYAGGHSHGWGATAMVIAATVLAARLLLATPVGPLRTAAFLVTAQLAAHLAATPFGHAVHNHATAVQTGHEHSAGLRRSVAPLAPVVMEWLGSGLSGVVNQPQMLTAHVAAAVLAAAWLARGERWAATTVTLLWATVIPASRPVLPNVGRFLVATPTAARIPSAVSRYRGKALARRGPPLALRTSLAV